MASLRKARNLAPAAQTRVMLVDDHEIMRDGLREVLQRAGEFEVVGQAGDGAAAVRIPIWLIIRIISIQFIQSRCTCSACIPSTRTDTTPSDTVAIFHKCLMF